MCVCTRNDCVWMCIQIGRVHTMMPGWAGAMVDFMRSGGYNVASQVKEVGGVTASIESEHETDNRML